MGSPPGPFLFLIRFLTDNGYSMQEEMRRRGPNVGRVAAAAVFAVALAALVAAGASAATAPTAITGPVTAVGATTATLSGTVNPNGDATSWHFDYGTTTSYGSSTSSTNAGSGTANTTVTANITGLTPGTTYHYRLVASEQRHDAGRGRDLHHGRGARRRDRCGDRRDRDLGDAQRHRQPERPADDVLVRVRQDDELRHEDAGDVGRLGHERDAGLRLDLGAAERTDLPLPARRHERRRHDARRRPHVHRRRHRPVGDDEGGDVRHLDRAPS